ncbi:MAG: hypothetical protein RSD62_07655 [Ruthenibacterium sp.]
MARIPSIATHLLSIRPYFAQFTIEQPSLQPNKENTTFLLLDKKEQAGAVSRLFFYLAADRSRLNQKAIYAMIKTIFFPAQKPPCAWCRIPRLTALPIARATG